MLSIVQTGDITLSTQISMYSLPIPEPFSPFGSTAFWYTTEVGERDIVEDMNIVLQDIKQKMPSNTNYKMWNKKVKSGDIFEWNYNK